MRPQNILFLNYIGEKFNSFRNVNYFHFVENDLENIAKLNDFGNYDLILGINTFHNVNYLSEYLLSVKNALNNGGILCGNFFGRNNLSELKKIIITRDSELSHNIYSRFNAVISADSVVGILQQLGFKNITTIMTPHVAVVG